MLLANISTINRLPNKLYKPKKFKEVMEYSMWKIWKKQYKKYFNHLLKTQYGQYYHQIGIAKFVKVIKLLN